MAEIEPRGALFRAVQVALEGQGATLALAADVFAAACITAAMRHPEWAAAVMRLYSWADISAMADELVAASSLEIVDGLGPQS